MRRVVVGANVFSCATGNLAIPPTSAGYTLQYSADGINFTSFETAVPASENCFVVGVPAGVFFKLNGNTDTVTILC